MRNGIAASSELSPRARQRIESLNNFTFVQLCYAAIFDRDPDSDGLEAQIAALDAGFGRLNLIDGFFQSAEFAARDPKGETVDRRLCFFDAGGFTDPSMRSLLNSTAARMSARVGS